MPRLISRKLTPPNLISLSRSICDLVNMPGFKYFLQTCIVFSFFRFPFRNNYRHDNFYKIVIENIGNCFLLGVVSLLVVKVIFYWPWNFFIYKENHIFFWYSHFWLQIETMYFNFSHFYCFIAFTSYKKSPAFDSIVFTYHCFPIRWHLV